MIKACIFDLGGTLVDRYSLVPLLALKKTFEKYNINVEEKLLIKDMGKHKLNHIQDILNYDEIKKQENYHTLNDMKLYNDFKKIQLNKTKKYMNVLSETKNCINYLQENNIKCGVTTGFHKEQVNLVKNLLESKNIYLDNYISSTCLDKPSRPYPYMIEENMKQLKIHNPQHVIKIDDTCVGIKEGLNAKCWTVGVARWSVNMDVYDMIEADKIDDCYTMYEDIYWSTILKNSKLKDSKKKLKDSGAHFVIDTLDDLKDIIVKINKIPITLEQYTKLYINSN